MRKNDKKKSNFHCKSEAQKRAIRATYARKSEKKLKTKPKKEDMDYYSESARHFRGHEDLVGNEIKYHPNSVVGEKDDYYISFGVTSAKKYDKKHNNHPLQKNPKKGSAEPAYIHKNPTIDLKSNYSSRYHDYELSKEDNRYIDERIEKWRKK